MKKTLCERCGFTHLADAESVEIGFIGSCHGISSVDIMGIINCIINWTIAWIIYDNIMDNIKIVEIVKQDWEIRFG